MKILGISCYSHDSAACLLKDGKVVAAGQEERFSRKKNTPDFPVYAANYCLQAGGITAADLDYVVFYEKPYLRFSRFLFGHAGAYPRSFSSFMRAMPFWLGDMLSLPVFVREVLASPAKTLFVPHHYSHAAAAFLPSQFERAAVLTADAVGEWATTCRGTGRGRVLSLDGQLNFPDSLGLLYTALTTYLGFEANEGEGKAMGLAGCGRPRFREEFRRLAEVASDGSFRLDMRYFSFYGSRNMYSPRLTGLLGPARLPGGPLEERHADIAASLQEFTEEVLLRLASDLRASSGEGSLCLAGGVFLNCAANARIQERAGFRDVFIQPAAGDAGGALGAALYAHNCLLGGERRYEMSHAYLGPEFSGKAITRAAAAAGLKAEPLEEAGLLRRTAALLAGGAVVGWFQGRMEYGPRALGNRSILGDPRNPEMKRLLNDRVKRREPFRPYAPAVPAASAAKYFELTGGSPFMLLAPKVREAARSLIPAACHDDGTARVQTVEPGSNSRFHALLEEFGALTGVPVLINTSFNRRGEPVVCTPAEAIDVYLKTEMDALVLGDCLLEKKRNDI